MTTVVRCGPVRIRLSGVDEVTKRRLRSAFFWSVDDQPTEDCSWSVTVAQRAAPPPAGDPAGDVVPYEFEEKAVVLREDPLTLWIPRTGGHIEIYPRQRAVTITNDDPRGTFVDVYRTIRQLLVSELTNDGYVCLHASCVAAQERSFAFVGDKGAGKTTLMTALAAQGFAVVSNDKLFVRPDGRVCHFPEAPAATVATLMSLPDWRHRLDLVRQRPEPAATLFLDHPALPLNEGIVASPQLHKVFFSEVEYLSLLGATGQTAARLDMVFEIDVERGGHAEIDADAAVPLARYHEELAPFPDWTRTRVARIRGSLLQIPTARLRPARGIEQTVAVVHEFIDRTLAG